MTNLRNSVLLMGNLGANPEFSKFSNGGMLTRFSVATHEYYRDQNDDLITKTVWHRCIAWGKTAERLSNLLHKGQKVAVRGKLTYRTYQDKEGVERTQAQVDVKEFVLMDKMEEKSEESRESSSQAVEKLEKQEA